MRTCCGHTVPPAPYQMNTFDRAQGRHVCIRGRYTRLAWEGGGAAHGPEPLRRSVQAPVWYMQVAVRIGMRILNVDARWQTVPTQRPHAEACSYLCKLVREMHHIRRAHGDPRHACAC